MDFIKDLQEARMTRNSHNDRILTYTDCCERTYLSLLALEVMSKFPTASAFVRQYARRTTAGNSFKYFRTNSTDLANFIYFVAGDEKAISKLKDPEAAQQMRNEITIPLMAVNRYITKLSTGSSNTGVSDFFVQLETKLLISNSEYKAVRRVIANFNSVTPKQRKEAVTRLLYAIRAKLRNSDIIEELQRVASIKDLEIPGVTDNEPTISVPDISAISGRELALYRLLVGDKQLLLAKQFVDRAKSSQATSGQMNNAYLPVIKLIDDIVKAGPSYIQQLRALQKRAKRDAK